MPLKPARLQKILLDHLGVASVSAVIGGSMGGMAVLEWPLTTPPSYVRNIVPLATSARHSAWGISWGEAQRQSVYSDPEYEGGWYSEDGGGPKRGLAAARMAALLTYRSRDSFESRFGRKEVDSDSEGRGKSKGLGRGKVTDAWGTPRTQAERAEAAHNDGHRARASPENGHEATSSPSVRRSSSPHEDAPLTPGGNPLPPPSPPPIFSAQSYLRYQGDKFVNRFDANCCSSFSPLVGGQCPPADPPNLLQTQIFILPAKWTRTISQEAVLQHHRHFPFTRLGHS